MAIGEGSAEAPTLPAPNADEEPREPNMQDPAATKDPRQSDRVVSAIERYSPIGVVAVVAIIIIAPSVINFLRDETVPGVVKATTVAVIFILVAVAAMMIMLALRKRSGAVERWTNAFGLLIVASLAGVVPVISLERGEQLFLVKLTVILLLAMIPGFLYLQFLAVRGQTLWEEFVENLRLLNIHQYGKPPSGPWVDLSDNLYAKKFEAVYGPVRIGGRAKNGQTKTPRRPRSQGETLVPMLWVTLLLAIGWTLVISPDPVRTAPWLRQFTVSLPVFVDPQGLTFGFIGAYFYTVQMVVRRFFQDDLKADAYINALQRIVAVALIVSVLSFVWPESWSEDALVTVAFFIGIFPQIGIDLLWELIKSFGVAKLRPSMTSDYPLSELDGLNVFYESRMLEEGIEDMQNLATADLVSLMLTTRIPLGRLIDWIDQSCLYLRLPPNEQGGAQDREILRCFSIRSATDLEQATKDASGAALRAAIDRHSTHGDGRIDAMLATLATEPNLTHVRAWKRRPLNENEYGVEHAKVESREAVGERASVSRRVPFSVRVRHAFSSAGLALHD